VTSGRVFGGPSRGSDAPTRTTWTRDGLGAIAAVLALGLVFRFLIVQVNPGSGFAVDIISFKAWASNLASQGLGGFYERPFFHDYTPGYLYVLYAVGVAGRVLGNIGDLIKIPPILADVVLGGLVWSMIRELGGGRRPALLGAALVVLNPVTWFDSAVWGQVDSFGVVFLLLGVRELWHDRPERAAIFTVVAALIKPQLAILAPIVAVVTIRRALRPATPPDEAGPVHDALGPPPSWLDRLRAAERRTDRPVRILTTGLAGFLTAVVLCWPFGLSVIDAPRAGEVFHSGLIEQVFKTAGGYPYASVNAYNPWALASVDGNGVAANGTWACDAVIVASAGGRVDCPEAVMVGPIPAVYAGAALLAVAFALVCLAVARRPTPLVILTGVTLLAIAFFILPTRVHERYLFPLVALGAILAGVSWRWLAVYLVLSLTTFLNMYVVLTTIYSSNPGIRDWLGIGSTLRAQTWVTTIVLAGLAAAIWAFGQLRPAARRALEDEVARGSDDSWVDEGDEDAGPSWASPPVNDRRRLGRTAADVAASEPVVVDSSAAGAAPSRVSAAPLPTWSEPPSFAELGPIGWFRARLDQRPTRADRSHGLHDEPGGRLDRLDLWILCVLVAAILGVRMFRLSEPYQMHFDEVYHARTATEFLEKWRYGSDPPQIYEWTHPHLAKYAMAAGLVAWGNDRVTASSELGAPVLDAVIERRTPDPADASKWVGDRIDVVTGSELRSYDLTTRKLITSQPIDGATAIAFDRTGNQLIVGTSDGSLWSFDVATLDAARSTGSSSLIGEPLLLGQVDGAVKHLFVPDDGTAIVAATGDDRLLVVDPSTAETRATIQLDGIADLAPGGNASTLVGPPGAVEDPTAAASTIASIVGGDPATYQARLTGAGDDAGRVVIAAVTDAQAQTDLTKAIDDGRLTGLSIDSLPRVAVADGDGVAFVTTEGGFVAQTVNLGGAAHGLAFTDVDSAKLYVATDPDPASDDPGRISIVAVGGDAAKNGASLVRTLGMPGPVARVGYDDATEMVHVLGRTPAGDAATIYVIEPHADAVYADAKLPFEPTAWALDVNRADPTDDRQQILVFDGAGDVASVDIGMHEFAWRLPGVLAGVVMAAFLYVLARILFRRRGVALIVGLLTLADGMLFVQSRIGMNDAYVGAGIVAAYTIFAALWTGAWRGRWAFWIGMPLVGVALGLALASKWVALYALIGIGFLILVRSALGRFLAILALILMTTVLGYLAINVPQGTGFGNLPFVAIMVGLTVVAVIANVTHPIRWSADETRFAIGAPVVAGALVALGAVALGNATVAITLGPATLNPLLIGLLIALLGAAVWLAFVAAARLGFGPLAPPPGPDEPAALLAPASPPPAAAWLRPGAQLGLPVVWMVACLLVLPVVLYVITYIPWALIDNHLILPGTGPTHIGAWPPGHTGQTLTDLTGAMYAYHNDLASPHAASSPWWAWLFDLKPVWFYQENLAAITTAAIYDAGNLVIWWLGLPALLFVAWQAYARRSLPLALIAIGYAFQWVAWARIDRAAFQYHYYTSLPFLVLALAYFLAELWHGASRRTWLFARLAAGAAIVGPAAAWVLARPVCAFVGVERVNQGSIACAPTIPQFVLTTQTAAIAVILGVSVLIVARLFGRLGDDRLADRDVIVGGVRLPDSTITLGLLAVTALVTIGLATFVRTSFGDAELVRIVSVPVEPVALVFAVVAVAIAAFVATVRDARRFVGGVLVAIVAWFIAVYPNFSALPLPTAIANVYQGILPTYLYAFQFPVNNVAAKVPIQLFSATPAILGGSVVFLAVVVGYSAWVWRLALAERLAEDDGAAPGGGLTADPGSGAVGD
jgi:4-amino-4-deoxy-L-arabinose transferase-like glycosyltransferase